MKNILIALLMIATMPAFSQKLIRNEVDEFKGFHVKETDYTNIVGTLKKNIWLAMRKADGLYFLSWAYGQTGISVMKGDELLFKLDNDSIVTLKSLDMDVARKGGLKHGKIASSGVDGVNVTYLISDTQIRQLLAATSIKYRFYASDGFLEGDLTKQQIEKMKKVLMLVVE